MRRAPILAAALLALGAAGGALAQDEPPAEPAGAGEAREEVGALVARLARERALPLREHARLRLITLGAGPLEREAVLELSLERRAGDAASEDQRPEPANGEPASGAGEGAALRLRVRFEAPPAERGVALLIERPGGGAAARAWRYDPARRRAAPCPPPPLDERLAGSALRWGDLLVDDPARWGTPRLEREATLRYPPAARSAPRAVYVLASAGEAGARRRLHVDRARGALLCAEELDRDGRVARALWAWDQRVVGERWRPFALRVVEREGERHTEVRAEERRDEVPPGHFDPHRFWR